MNARMLVTLCTVAIMLPATGQEAPVMKEGQVSESALIDALAPDQPIRTRSLRVTRDINADKAASRPPSASLLITFETNSAELTPQARLSLDTVGQALASDRLSVFRFAIEGHADPRGVPSANFKLSQLRAQSVRDYLVSARKIDSTRLEAVGKGAQEPLNRSNPEAPENRRVTIVNLSR